MHLSGASTSWLSAEVDSELRTKRRWRPEIRDLELRGGHPQELLATVASSSSSAMPSLEELREAFAHTREQLHADDSEIFASDIPELPPGLAPESPDSAADGARTASEILAAAPALHEQVESLQRRLADAEQRAARNAECAQRQVEIHMTLLHAAHDAATESRDETRADAERLREQLATTARELADARERVGLQAERYQAELALVREQAAARAEDGRRALAFVRAEASAERALLAAELRACERAGGGAGAASPVEAAARGRARARPPPSRRASPSSASASTRRPPRGRSRRTPRGSAARRAARCCASCSSGPSTAATRRRRRRRARRSSTSDSRASRRRRTRRRWASTRCSASTCCCRSGTASCSDECRGKRRIKLYQRTTLFTCRIAPPLEITIGRCGAPFTPSAAPVAAASPSAGALGCSRSLGRGCSLHSSRKASRLA